MPDERTPNLNVEFLDDPITMSFPFGDFKILKGKLWTDPKGVQKQLPDRYNYTVNRPGHGEGREAVKFYLRADEWLHKTIQAAAGGLLRGVTLTIRHRTNPEDKKKKFWEVRRGDGALEKVFSSLDLSKDAPQGQESAPKTQNSAQPTPDTAPASEPPHTADSPPTGNGYTRTGNGHPMTFGEVACIAWKSHRASADIWEALKQEKGLDYDAGNVQASANSLGIACEKGHIRPSEKDMEAFKAAMRTPRTNAGPFADPATTPTTSPAGSDPIGGDEYFNLVSQADEAGVLEVDLRKFIRSLLATHLKVKNLPPGYDMGLTPAALVPIIVTWIGEQAFKREEEAEEAGKA